MVDSRPTHLINNRVIAQQNIHNRVESVALGAHRKYLENLFKNDGGSAELKKGMYPIRSNFETKYWHIIKLLSDKGAGKKLSTLLWRLSCLLISKRTFIPGKSTQNIEIFWRYYSR